MGQRISIQYTIDVDDLPENVVRLLTNATTEITVGDGSDNDYIQILDLVFGALSANPVKLSPCFLGVKIWIENH